MTTDDDNNNTAEDHDDDERQCPVCLTLEETLVCGPCRHSTCVPCMEQILNARGEQTRWPPPTAADNHLSAPTLGRCPICRRELSLFEMVDQDSGKVLCPKDTNYWCKDHLLSKAPPLKDAVYVPYHGKVGQLSFHWDWDKIKDTDKDNNMELPFLNLSIPVKKDWEKWRLEDGTLTPVIKYFEPGSHFHKDSRTFHGKISWAPTRLNGSYEWEVVLGFPPDYRFIRSGQIHMRRDRLVDDKSLTDDYTTEQRKLCRFPMDGRWTITWTTNNGEEKRAEIHVKNNEYRQSGYPFYLNFDDPLYPTVRWPRSTHSQTVQEGVDLVQDPMGPAVGSKIRWTTTSSNFSELYWERQTMGPVPSPHVILFGMGAGKQLYQRLDASLNDVSVIPKHNGDIIWGNVFCKRLYVGSASYHFLSPTNSFLSYRHPACRDLPPMDDGTPLPTRVDFHDLEWDPEERKLTASIEWEKDFGISWNENVRWKLTMYFDSEYMIILKGGIQCEWCQEKRARPRPPRVANPHRPPPVPVYVPPPEEEKQDEEKVEEAKEPEEPDRNEEWIMSGYGHDQLYINAAMLERYRNSTVVVDYKDIGKEQLARLEREGATKRSLGFVEHVFDLAARNPSSSPIDFLV
jgi:hypothetical protein